MKQMTQTQSHSVTQTHGQKATSSCYCLYGTYMLVQPAPVCLGVTDTRTIRHTDNQTHGHSDQSVPLRHLIPLIGHHLVPMVQLFTSGKHERPQNHPAYYFIWKRRPKKFWILFDRNPPKKETFVDILVHFQTPLLFFLTHTYFRDETDLYDHWNVAWWLDLDWQRPSWLPEVST